MVDLTWDLPIVPWQVFGGRGLSVAGVNGAGAVLFSSIFGVWLSLVERCVRDAKVAGSNPVTPIWQFARICR